MRLNLGKKRGGRVATVQLVLTIVPFLLFWLIGGAVGDAPHVHKLRHKYEHTKNSSNNNNNLNEDTNAGAGADADADAGKQLDVAHRALETTISPTVSEPGERIKIAVIDVMPRMCCRDEC